MAYFVWYTLLKCKTTVQPPKKKGPSLYIYMGNTLRWAHPGKRLVVVSTSAPGLQQRDRQRRKVRARGGGYFVAPIGNRQLRCSPTSASQPVTAAQGSLVSMHPPASPPIRSSAMDAHRCTMFSVASIWRYYDKYRNPNDKDHQLGN